MISFSCKPCFEDYIEFEKFKEKINKSFFLIYVMCSAFSVWSIYLAVESKRYEMLLFIPAVILFMACDRFIKKSEQRKRITRMISLDSSYLNENQIIIDDNFIEIKTIPQQNQTGSVAVYPYSVISMIYETAQYYYFFIGTEVKILSKRDLPHGCEHDIKKILSSKRNYVFVK